MAMDDMSDIFITSVPVDGIGDPDALVLTREQVMDAMGAMQQLGPRPQADLSTVRAWLEDLGYEVQHIDMTSGEIVVYHNAMGSNRASLAGVKARLQKGRRNPSVAKSRLLVRVGAVNAELARLVQLSDENIRSRASGIRLGVRTALEQNVIEDAWLSDVERQVSNLVQKASHSDALLWDYVARARQPAETPTTAASAYWGKTTVPEPKRTQEQEVEDIRRELDGMGLRNGDESESVALVLSPTTYPVPQPRATDPVFVQLRYLVGRTWYRFKQRVFNVFSRSSEETQ